MFVTHPLRSTLTGLNALVAPLGPNVRKQIASSSSLLTILLLAGVSYAQPLVFDEPAIIAANEPGWTLLYRQTANDAAPIAFDADGALVFGTYHDNAVLGEVVRRNLDGGYNALWRDTTSEVSGVLARTVSETWYAAITPGSIYRLVRQTNGSYTRSTIVTKLFNTGDDDPVALVQVPAGYTGPLVVPGDVLVADVGVACGSSTNPVEGLYVLTTATSPKSNNCQTASGVGTNGKLCKIVLGSQFSFFEDGQGDLSDPTDVTVTKTNIYMTDAKYQAIYRVYVDPAPNDRAGQLTTISTSPPIGINEHPVAVEWDPVTQNDLLVLLQDDSLLDDGGAFGRSRLVRLKATADPDFFNMVTIAENLFPRKPYGYGTCDDYAYQSLAISPDGAQLAVVSRYGPPVDYEDGTYRNGNAVFVWARCAKSASNTTRDCNLNGVYDVCDIKNGADDCDSNGRPDSCDITPEKDCDGDGRLDICPVCESVEAVFVFDTSTTMADDAQAMCEFIDNTVAQLRYRGVDLHPQVYGVDVPDNADAEKFLCLSAEPFATAYDYKTLLANRVPDSGGLYGNTTPEYETDALFPDGGCPAGEAGTLCLADTGYARFTTCDPGSSTRDTPEDWGRAITVAAEFHPWLADSIRLMIPISDEGPFCGSPRLDFPGDDLIAKNAAKIAERNRVILSPVLASGFQTVTVESGYLGEFSGLLDLATHLAAETNGEVVVTPTGGTSISADAIYTLVVDACNTPDDCDDNGIKDICQPDPPCKDDNLCTNDICVGTGCIYTEVACPEDDNPCTVAQCDPAVGCRQVPIEEVQGPTSCNDGLKCTSNDMCSAGQCVGTQVTCNSPPLCGGGGRCDEDTGACEYQPLSSATPCSDDNACTIGDHCDGETMGPGSCEPGTPKTCVASGQCHEAGTCDISTGLCSNPPSAPGKSCVDALPCTVNETCDGAGQCVGVQKQCPESECRYGQCRPNDGQCVLGLPKPDGTSCNDSDLCVTGDQCLAGDCRPGAAVVQCDPATQCRNAEVCVPQTGQCTGGEAKPSTTPCDADSDACTIGDRCGAGSNAGTCVAGPRTECDDEDLCTNDSCDSQTGACRFTLTQAALACQGAGGQCSPGQVCDPDTGGCANIIPDPWSCNDDDACTANDQCKPVGLDTYDCQGTQIPCDDPPGQCWQSEGCVGGECKYTVTEGVGCDDDDPCTRNDTCAANGECVGALRQCPELDESAIPNDLLDFDDQPEVFDPQCYNPGACVADASEPEGWRCDYGEDDDGNPLPAYVAMNTLCEDDGNPCTPEYCNGGGVCSIYDFCDGSAEDPPNCGDEPPLGTRGSYVYYCPSYYSCYGDAECNPDTGVCYDYECPPGLPCEPVADCDIETDPDCFPYPVTDENGSPITVSCQDEDDDLCTFNETCDGRGNCGSEGFADVTVCEDDPGDCLVDPVCDPTDGQCYFSIAANEDQVSCNDGKDCTKPDVCLNGTCVGITDCDDDDPCTVDSCGPDGACVYIPGNVGAACDDDSVCTTNDKCQGGPQIGTCAGSAIQCTDGNACTLDQCDPLTGCVFPPAPNGTSCSDGNLCTAVDQCVGGACMGSSPVSCPTPQNPCLTQGTCAPATGLCTLIPVANGTSCDADHNPCTIDTCLSGSCLFSESVDCNDHKPCTADSCNALGECENLPLVGKICDDGDACTPETLCDASGECVGPVRSCDDGNVCTDDRCESNTRPGTNPCVNTPDVTNDDDGTVSCSDGQWCTVDDECAANGGCVGAPRTCPEQVPGIAGAVPNDECTVGLPCATCFGQWECNEQTDTCVEPYANGADCVAGGCPGLCSRGLCLPRGEQACDDFDPCTFDYYDCTANNGGGGCVFEPLLEGDWCDTDFDECTIESCRLVADVLTCEIDETTTCNDYNLCTNDYCDHMTGECVFDARPNEGLRCDDEALCTNGDVCVVDWEGCEDAQNGPCPGECLGQQETCSQDDDEDDCWLPIPLDCDPDDGLCWYTLREEGEACNDYDPCTLEDKCNDIGDCTGVLVPCDDANPCTVDACVNGSCTNEAVEDGMLCDDADVCTVASECQAGTCVGAAWIDCDDGEECTDDSCDAVTGCFATPVTDGNTCNDDNACTLGDSCLTGACIPGEPLECEALDQCHVAGVCHPLTGECSNPPVGDGTLCDDGSACTSNDNCKQGVCIPGRAVVCDDNDPCTVDECGVSSCPAPEERPGGTVHGALAFDGGVLDAGWSVAQGQPGFTEGRMCVGAGSMVVLDATVPGHGYRVTATARFGAFGDDAQPGLLFYFSFATPTGPLLRLLGVAGDLSLVYGEPPERGIWREAMPSWYDGALGDDEILISHTSAGNGAFSIEIKRAGQSVFGPFVIEDLSLLDPEVIGLDLEGVGILSYGYPTGNETCIDDIVVDIDWAEPCPQGCVFTPGNDGAACDDEDKCTLASECSAGSCVGTVDRVCDDDKTCTTDSCDPDVGCVYADLPITQGCDDGNVCTMDDRCDGEGACVGQLRSCDDGNVCTTDTCDPSVGCKYTNLTSATSCDDGSLCTTDDKCNGAGGCAGTPVLCTAADDCHAPGTCNPADGVCSAGAALPSGTLCNDDDNCTQVDKCDGQGQCVGSGTPVCNDGNACTTDSCVSPAGCVFTDKANTETCDDGNLCTTVDRCDGQGACVGSGSLSCNDNNVCTTDACDPSVGCKYTNASSATSCNDGSLCTTNDRCNGAGGCAGSPVVCTASDDCHAAGTCDPANGQCSAGAALPNGSLCNDDNACTRVDTCRSGACVGGSPIVCEATECRNAGTCDPDTGECGGSPKANGTSCSDFNVCTLTDSCQNGSCVGTGTLSCDDKDPCTIDVCDPRTGCTHTPAATGTACDDGNACTTASQCNAGKCVAIANLDCSDDDPCSVDRCDPAIGCVDEDAPDGTRCDDGSLCTQVDGCQAGACVGGFPVVCAASDQCHLAGTCNPRTGQCSNPVAPPTTVCDDGSVCTTGDRCQEGACVGARLGCDDGDPCTLDGCDAAVGCVNTEAPDNTPCSDSDPCTTANACIAGSCVATAYLACDDQNPCTVDHCAAGVGCATEPADDGLPCSDDDLCTTADTCLGGVCAGRGAPCDDRGECFAADGCNAQTGTCEYLELPGDIPVPIAVIGIGSLGGPQSRATAIDDAGRVAGDSDVAGGRRHAFVWQDGALTDLTPAASRAEVRDIEDGVVAGVLEDGDGSAAFRWKAGALERVWALPGALADARVLGPVGGAVAGVGLRNGQVSALFAADGGSAVVIAPPANGGEVEPLALNVRGEVVGRFLASDGERHAFRWTAAGGFLDLGAPGEASVAYAIDSAGVIVGQRDGQAFVRDANGGMTDLGFLCDGGNPASCGSTSEALFVNDGGVVLGRAEAPGGSAVAFRWTRAGGMFALETLGGDTAAPVALAGSGHAVGESTTDWGATHAVLWTASGERVALGSFAAASSSAVGVNTLGQVAGILDQGGKRRAFLWASERGLVDLGTLGGAEAEAADLDASGRVVGWAHDADGRQRAFVSEAPRTACVVCDDDRRPPEIVCPVVFRPLECVSGGAEVFLGSPTVFDACGQEIDVSSDAPVVFPRGITKVTFDAVDAAGNLASCATTVVVEDTAPPVVSCPESVQVSAVDGLCGATAAWTVSALDACDGEDEIEIVAPDAGWLYPVGSSVAEVAAIDRAGNRATCRTVVEVTDPLPFAITCPETIELAAPADRCGYPNAVEATVQARCRDSFTVRTSAEGFPIGTSTLAFSAVDNDGETAACETRLVVSDVTAPTVGCGTLPEQLEPSAQPAVIVATATDACGATPVVSDIECVDAEGATVACDVRAEGAALVVGKLATGQYTLRWTVTASDASGNSESIDCELAARGQGDRDGDTLIDDIDNCPDDRNFDQADADGDGLGNVCDPEFTGIAASGSGGCAGASDAWWLFALFGGVLVFVRGRRRTAR